MTSLDGCLFCGIVDGTVPSARVAEDETTLAFMDINPVSEGHVLVAPKRHSVDLIDMPTDDLVDVTTMAQRIAIAALPALGADGVNLLNCSGAVAWQSVFHVHLHVIPRYHDKTSDHGLEVPFEHRPTRSPEALADLAATIAAVM